MRTRLEHLDNNEAVLLMYLFEELPPEDRAEVERMLQNDGGLQLQYEALREVHAKVDSLMQEADRQAVMPVAPAAADRQIMRLIRQWSTRRMSAGPTTNRRRGMPIWIYPMATAAAVLIASMVWWGFHDGGVDFLPPSTPENPIVDTTDPDGVPERPMQMDVHFALLRSFDSFDELHEVEQQIQVLAERRDEYTPILSLDPMSR